MDISTFKIIAFGWILLAIFTFILLQFIVAPFGRYTRNDWGATISNNLGWMIMESVSLISFLFFFLNGSLDKTITMWVLAALWSAH